ncbi:MAG: DUF5329 family protein [Spirochaetes bacterium]|nr:DUF5329 family protein [Spirochaetota bacterium]
MMGRSMSIARRTIYLLLMAALVPLKAPAMTEQEKIRALLDRVEASGLVFIRNGTEYSSREARKHLELKLSKAGSAIRTAEQFITHIASGSTWSGAPYYIKLRDGSVVKSADWLRKNLAGLERKRR